MAEEAKADDGKKEEAPAPAPAPAKTNNNNGGRNNNKKEETPVEELYDLSKPIPKVPKPDKGEHEKQLAELTAALDKLKDDRQKIQKEIDAVLDKSKNTALGKAREEVQKLRQSKNALIEEKKQIRSKLDAAKSQADKIMKDRKDARGSIRYSDPVEIDKEIAKLQRKQETTSMSLAAEKLLIREIETLKNSKSIVASLKEKDGAMDNVKEERRSIQDILKAKDKEIDGFSKQIEEKMNVIKGMNDKDTEKRDKVQSWFKKRDELRQAFTDKLKEKDAIRAEYREQNNVWYNNQRAVRAQKKIQYEEEKKKREEEHAEYLKKVEEEEAKKIPYEAEQALCDYLADYLTSAYLTDGSEKKEEKKADIVAVKDDPFANFKPVQKQEDEVFFGKGKGKKKRDRSNKKQDQKGAAPFKLSVDTFGQFGLIGMNPPTSLEQVEATVKALREKKEWYSQQPRGSVPTAQEIRKANEKQSRNNGNNNKTADNSKKQNNKGNKKNFDLSNDSDFAPLPGSTGGTGAVSLWGKGATLNTPPTQTRNDPTPGEAAA